MNPLVAAAFAYLSFMWGSSYMFIKIGLNYWPPVLMASSRNLVASIAMLLLIFALRRRLPGDWRSWWPPIGFGLINGTAFALIFWGGQFIPSGQTAVLIATVPLFSLFLGALWLGERITWLKVAAVAVGLAGVALATGTREGVGFTGTDAQRLTGQLAMLGAAFCYGLSYVWSKRFFTAGVYENTAIGLGAAGLYLLVLSLLFDPAPTTAILTWPAIGSVLYLALLGSALAYMCMFYLIKHLNSVQTTYFTLINPIVALLLGVTIMGEELRTGALTGSALVLMGAWLVTRPGPQEPALPEPAVAVAGGGRVLHKGRAKTTSSSSD